MVPATLRERNCSITLPPVRETSGHKKCYLLALTDPLSLEGEPYVDFDRFDLYSLLGSNFIDPMLDVSNDIANVLEDCAGGNSNNGETLGFQPAIPSLIVLVSRFMDLSVDFDCEFQLGNVEIQKVWT